MTPLAKELWREDQRRRRDYERNLREYRAESARRFAIFVNEWAWIPVALFAAWAMWWFA